MRNPTPQGPPLRLLSTKLPFIFAILISSARSALCSATPFSVVFILCLLALVFPHQPANRHSQVSSFRRSTCSIQHLPFILIFSGQFSCSSASSRSCLLSNAALHRSLGLPPVSYSPSLSCILLIYFILSQIYTQNPTLPMDLLTQRSIICSAFFASLLFAALVSILYALPICFQSLLSRTAARSSVNTLLMLFSWSSALLSPVCSPKWRGYYVPFSSLAAGSSTAHWVPRIPNPLRIRPGNGDANTLSRRRPC